MADSNKVVIKIKYPGADKKLREQLRPEMVTKWNVQRILFALTVLIIFILVPFYYFSNGSPDSEKNEVLSEKYNDKAIQPSAKLFIQDIEKEQLIIATKLIDDIEVVEELEVQLSEDEVEKEKSKSKSNTDIKSINNIEKLITPDVKLSAKVAEKESLVTVIKSDNNETEEQSVVKSAISSKIISDAKVARALLTSGLNNKEPLAGISLPLVVNKNKAAQVYYFTEIINMKGETLYHHWLRDGQNIYKKELNILGNRWRASTSKLIPYSKTGLWRAELVNKEDVILNEIEFNVIKEQ
jgi:hypothetical protein